MYFQVTMKEKLQLCMTVDDRILFTWIPCIETSKGIIILENMQDHRTSLNIYKVSKIFVRNKTQSNHNNPCPLVPEVMQTTTHTDQKL